MLRKLAAIVGLLFLLKETTEASPAVEVYSRTPSQWVVFFHRATGNCGMIREHQRGTAVIVNYERSNDSWTFSLSNQKWDKVQPNEKYHIYLRFDGGASDWQGDFVGSVWDGRPLISLPGTKTSFLKGFMQYNEMSIGTSKDGWVTTVYLDGSWEAMLKTIDCQRYYQ